MRASTTTIVLSLVAAVAGMSLPVPVPVNPPSPANEIMPRGNGLPVNPEHVSANVNSKHVKAPKPIKGRLPRAAPGLPIRPQDMAPQPVKGVLPRSLSLSNIKNSVDPGCDENNVSESGFPAAGIHVAGSGSNHRTSPINFDPATRNGNSNGLAVAASLGSGVRNALNSGVGFITGNLNGVDVNAGNRNGLNAGNRNGHNTNGLNIGAGITSGTRNGVNTGSRNDPNAGTRTGLNHNGLAAGAGVGTGHSNGLAVGAGLATGNTYSNGRQNNHNTTEHSIIDSKGVKAIVNGVAGKSSSNGYGAGNNGNNGIKVVNKAADGISSTLSSDPECDTPEGSAGAAGVFSAVFGTSSNGPCENCEGGVTGGIAGGLAAGVGL